MEAAFHPAVVLLFTIVAAILLIALEFHEHAKTIEKLKAKNKELEKKLQLVQEVTKTGAK